MVSTPVRIVAAAFMLIAVDAFSACVPYTPPAPAPCAARDRVDVGYGTQSRATITGAVASMSREQIEARHAHTTLELLEDLAGVRVLRSGGDLSARVRGARSEPLFVVDGTPLVAPAASDVLSLPAANIERIAVLEDAGAVASYGARGSNGVIFITTRRWRRC